MKHDDITHYKKNNTKQVSSAVIGQSWSGVVVEVHVRGAGLGSRSHRHDLQNVANKRLSGQKEPCGCVDPGTVRESAVTDRRTAPQQDGHIDPEEETQRERGRDDKH